MRTKQCRATRTDVVLNDPRPRDSKNAQDIKSALCNLLEGIESGGSFATFGVCPEAPLPDLSLHGFGPIPLPLAPRDADAICKEPTEDDKESAPRVEKAVDRKSGKHLHNQWEMKKDNLMIRNPAWNEFVQRITVKAAEDLGIKTDVGTVKADMERAHLSAVGGSIQPYDGIPNVPGSLGKILICLPAGHQGGSLLTTYAGESKKFSTKPSSSWGYSYIAWYAGVTLEFKPLDSGHRLMLEYDLILPPPAKLPSLDHLYGEKEKLRNLLAAWKDGVERDCAAQTFNFPTLLVYICDCHYASQSLSLHILQGDDQLRAACLKDLCSQIGIGVYIADLDRTHSGFCDYHPSYYGSDDHHYIETDDEDSITPTKVVEVSGGTVVTGTAIVEENFLQSEPFDDDPDDEDFDENHGLVTHYYRKTVLVLIPSVAKGEWLPDEKKTSRPNKRKRSVEIIELE